MVAVGECECVGAGCGGGYGCGPGSACFGSAYPCEADGCVGVELECDFADAAVSVGEGYADAC